MDAGIVLVRRSEPTELDIAPYGTQCKVMDHYDGFDMYLQVGSNEDHPCWDLLGNFTTKAHPDLLKDLIDARLRKYSHSN